MRALGTIVDLLAKRTDLLFAVFFLVVVSMMILPLPTVLIDMLIGFNLAFSLIIIVTAIYLRSSLELSTFPAIILVGTVFRLALTISTTRLVLAEGDAGAIISAFGSFVVAGNVVVGLVVFLIVALVQFLVVTKGAERVAEVGARFTLDAMPGKQLAIDSDLRNGHITAEQALKRRSTLEKESQFFGAMDGAMRFVKGDAIAALVVVAVNLIGGLAIGIFQRGLSFSEAIHIYSLLSIGDGLVSQIPSMLMAIAAGTVVTRVSSEDSQSLGADIGRQLSRDPRALGVAGAMTVAMGFVPGFPGGVLWPLGIGLGLTAFMLARPFLREGSAASPGAQRTTPEVVSLGTALDRAKFGDPIVATVSETTLASLERGGFASILEGQIRSLARVVGVAVTVPTFNADARMADNLMHVQIENVPAGMIPIREGEGLEMVAGMLRRLVRRHVGPTFSVEDVTQWLSGLETRLGGLSRDVAEGVPRMLMVNVTRRLLDEGVTLSQPRGFLEVMLDYQKFGGDVDLLAQEARKALGSQVAYGLLDQRGVVSSIPLGSNWEMAVEAFLDPASNTQRKDAEKQIAMMARSFNARLLEANERDYDPVGLVDPDLRQQSQLLLIKHGCRLPLLAHDEIPPDITCQILQQTAPVVSARKEMETT